jgi:glycerol kinase
MRYLMALDQGTSSTRTLILDTRGQIKAMAQRALPQHFPQPGWVEHDAHEIWQHQKATMLSALQQSGLTAGDIAAIGITNQRETVVLWDRSTGQALGPALVWQDRRTETLCQSLRTQGHEAMVKAKTGLLLDPYFSGTKMKWLLDHHDPQRTKSRRGDLALGTIDSWLLWNLTAHDGGEPQHLTEPTNASRTLLFNLHTGQWDEELMALLDVPLDLLPKIVPSCGPMGHTPEGLLGARIPITGVAGDQQAALFGQGCWQAGELKATYGTGCFLLMHTGQDAPASASGLLTTAAAQTGGDAAFALEGSVFMAGAVVQWLRDGLGIIQNSGEVEALAQSVPDAGGVTLIPAFTGLGAPYWRADARAALLGMSRGTTRAHIARAALDSIAMQTAALVRAMNQDAHRAGIGAVHSLRVDGGACQNNLLMQMQADVLGVPVLRPKMTEVTALGAACLAGLGAGVLSSTEGLKAMWQLDRAFEPQRGADWMAQQWAAWDKAVAQTLMS